MLLRFVVHSVMVHVSFCLNLNSPTPPLSGTILTSSPHAFNQHWSTILNLIYTERKSCEIQKVGRRPTVPFEMVSVMQSKVAVDTS